VRQVTGGEAGVIGEMDAREIGLAANALGAGRARVGDRVDPAVGFVVLAKLGDRVEAGQPLAEVHALIPAAADAAARRYRAAVRIADSAASPRPIVLEPARAG
jgi:thymidine phosphorylase